MRIGSFAAKSTRSKDIIDERWPSKDNVVHRPVARRRRDARRNSNFYPLVSEIAQDGTERPQESRQFATIRERIRRNFERHHGLKFTI